MVNSKKFVRNYFHKVLISASLFLIIDTKIKTKKLSNNKPNIIQLKIFKKNFFQSSITQIFFIKNEGEPAYSLLRFLSNKGLLGSYVISTPKV